MLQEFLRTCLSSGPRSKVNRAGKLVEITLGLLRIEWVLLEHWTIRALAQMQCLLNNIYLKFWIIGVAQGPAKWKGDPKSTGRFDCLGMLPYQADLRCNDSFGFNIMR